MFGQRQAKRRPTRGELLDRASRARSKGNRKKAIKALQEILVDSPEDWAIHSKLAPLLLDSGNPIGAWECWREAARGYELEGFVDKAFALLSSVVERLPQQSEAWELLAEMYVDHERTADAIATLVEGQHYLQTKKDRVHAIRMLRRACELESGHFVATFALARTLVKAGHKGEGTMALKALEGTVTGRKARMVRYALFRYQPGPRTLWRWLSSSS